MNFMSLCVTKNAVDCRIVCILSNHERGITKHAI